VHHTRLIPLPLDQTTEPLRKLAVSRPVIGTQSVPEVRGPLESKPYNAPARSLPVFPRR
jgi:hypothetical protein